MILEATDLGLDSVWVCNFKSDVLKAAFKIPEEMEIMNVLAIGYGCDTPKSPERHAAERVPLKDKVIFA